MGDRTRDIEKRAAAEAAAELVRDGDRVGLGTGSTVAFLLPALAARRLAIRCAATSPATESIAPNALTNATRPAESEAPFSGRAPRSAINPTTSDS